jgi:cytochrome c peroxidase
MPRRRAGLGLRHLVLGGLILSLPGVVRAQEQGWKPLPGQAKPPAGNPTTREKVELGKKLFFDPRLSVTGTVSCNSCHNVMEGGDDGRPSSMGVHGRRGPRNAPTVWNAAFQGAQFWDGRAPSLEEQAKGPIVAGPEMGMPSHDAALERVRAIPGYVQEFKQVFGSDQPVTIDNAAKAIAAFERTLITPGSPYDRFAKGESSALSPVQKAGMALFREVGCVSCHSGPAFNGPQWNRPGGPGFYRKFPAYTDNAYVKTYALDQDPGRAAVTGSAADAHTFKVTTLRNVELTAPYFHNGAVPTLDKAVRVMAATQLAQDLPDEDAGKLVAFLGALTGEFPAITLPRLPFRSGETELGTQEPAATAGDRK